MCNDRPNRLITLINQNNNSLSESGFIGRVLAEWLIQFCFFLMKEEFPVRRIAIRFCSHGQRRFPLSLVFFYIGHHWILLPTSYLAQLPTRPLVALRSIRAALCVPFLCCRRSFVCFAVSYRPRKSNLVRGTPQRHGARARSFSGRNQNEA